MESFSMNKSYCRKVDSHLIFQCSEKEEELRMLLVGAKKGNLATQPNNVLAFLPRIITLWVLKIIQIIYRLIELYSHLGV